MPCRGTGRVVLRRKVRASCLRDMSPIRGNGPEVQSGALGRSRPERLGAEIPSSADRLVREVGASVRNGCAGGGVDHCGEAVARISIKSYFAALPSFGAKGPAFFREKYLLLL